MNRFSEQEHWCRTWIQSIHDIQTKGFYLNNKQERGATINKNNQGNVTEEPTMGVQKKDKQQGKNKSNGRKRRTQWHENCGTNLNSRHEQKTTNEKKDKGRHGLFMHWGRGAQVRTIKGRAEHETQVTEIKKRSQMTSRKMFTDYTDFKIKQETDQNIFKLFEC